MVFTAIAPLLLPCNSLLLLEVFLEISSQLYYSKEVTIKLSENDDLGLYSAYLQSCTQQINLLKSMGSYATSASVQSRITKSCPYRM